jgi:hypothetical protein
MDEVESRTNAVQSYSVWTLYDIVARESYTMLNYFV